MRERHLNILVLALLAAVPLWAYVSDEPFTITLSTKVAILALAGVGLTLRWGLADWSALGRNVFRHRRICHGHTGQPCAILYADL